MKKYFSMQGNPSPNQKILRSLLLMLMVSLSCQAQDSDQWIQFTGTEGPGNGKHIVLISGDDEYRSEEGLPMLGKILAERHGFTCTVLFAIDPKTDEITPNYPNNIPGLEHLETADLMIMLLRFRELPDDQMKRIDDYVRSGKPMIGLRTSTHAFNFGEASKSPYAKYSWQNKGEDWKQGFGREVLGETWVSHHGHHGEEGTRALVDGINQVQDHPILRGVQDIWGPSDVYTVQNLPKEANVLLYGQSTQGMNPEDPLMWEKSIMPLAWTLDYTGEDGNVSKVFTTTMGASVDLESEDLRRLIVNASFWSLDMGDAIGKELNVDYVGEYRPTMFGFDEFQRGLKPQDYK